MSERPPSITSATIPDAWRRTVLAAALLLSVPALIAAAPLRTQRFIVEAPQNASERSGVLEAAYTEFLFATNTRPDVLPAPLTVTIYADQAAFRAKTGSGKRVAHSARDISSYEQGDLNALLVRELVSLLFEAACGGRAGRDVDWLEAGIADAVEARRARVGSGEASQRLRVYLKKEGPISLQQLMGTVKVSSNVNEQRRYRASAASLAGYLLRLDGGLGLRYLLAEIAAGRALDAAVERAYPGRYRNMAELYGVWMEKEIGLVRPPAFRQ